MNEQPKDAQVTQAVALVAYEDELKSVQAHRKWIEEQQNNYLSEIKRQTECMEKQTKALEWIAESIAKARLSL